MKSVLPIEAFQNKVTVEPVQNTIRQVIRFLFAKVAGQMIDDVRVGIQHGMVALLNWRSCLIGGNRIHRVVVDGVR